MISILINIHQTSDADTVIEMNTVPGQKQTHSEEFYSEVIMQALETVRTAIEQADSQKKSDIISKKTDSTKSPKQKLPAWGNSQKKSLKNGFGRSGK